MSLQGLSRLEKLKKRSDINRLFSEGKTFKYKTFLIKWQLLPSEEVKSSLKMMVGVPKKNFRKAVDRNRIKRLIREGFRKNKQPLAEAVSRADKSMRIAIIYADNSIPAFSEVEDKIILILRRLAGYV